MVSINGFPSDLGETFNLTAEEKRTFVLNLVTIGGFVLYVIGIYLHVVILGNEWGNVAVDLSIRVLGPILGLFLVVVIGVVILFLSFFIKRLRITNIYLCWFWIISLYQCAVNSFLQFYQLPDEPINLFFKFLFPYFWYPAKEVVFVLTSILLTILWIKKVDEMNHDNIDVLLIILISSIMIIGTLSSQLLLINT
ncbi:MAG: hypothetical protein ACTSVY_10145 [Candidatus Helarchaeota archaeon]